MVRTGAKGSYNIRAMLSTFLEPPNDDSTKAYLQTLAKQIVEVNLYQHACY